MSLVNRPVSRSVSRPAAYNPSSGPYKYDGESLSIDFVNKKYSLGRPGQFPSDKLFSDIITFTRSSSGYRTNELGLLESVAYYPRRLPNATLQALTA